MLHSLDDAFVCARLDAKYGVSHTIFSVPSVIYEDSSVDEKPLHFAPLPSERVRNTTAVYVPRLHPVDDRRTRFLNVYRNVSALQDLRDISSVPTTLAHVARPGLRHVLTSGPVRMNGTVIAVVSSREVGALLVEVVRHTSGLQEILCTRLVAHMCNNAGVAMEWIACFSD